jgi:4a-hydroxytetrahydrobiopterin dehydratase
MASTPPARIGAETALAGLPHWRKIEGRDAIGRTFTFKDFKRAWAFMYACALKAEQMDHHPEWFNVYAKVDVVLTTHDADGVSAKDVELARFMDEIA